MKLPVYRRNVLKTLSIKPAKAGLRYVARNTKRTNVFHAAVGMATEVGELLQATQNYLLEGRVSKDERDNAFEEMGDYGYYLTVACHNLKVKMPSSTKKIKLVGTRGKALLDLNSITTDILSIAKKNFYGVKEHEHLADNGKAKMVLDVAAQELADTEHSQKIVELLEKAIPLYWALCYSLFEVTPDHVMAGNIAKLSVRFPDGTFEYDKVHAPRDQKKDQAAALDASEVLSQEKMAASGN